MNNISTIFFDLGGVCLTNGWDINARTRAAEHFQLNFKEFEKRHQQIYRNFEKGLLTNKEYLDHVIFYIKRNFLQKDLIKFMEAQSQPFPGAFNILEKISAQHKYMLATINNESLELNRYRIKKFKLKKYFSAFFSSCFVGSRKPEKNIYETALNILQQKPDECLFIDDRKENIEGAQKLKINVIHLKNVNELSEKLKMYQIKY